MLHGYWPDGVDALPSAGLVSLVSSTAVCFILAKKHNSSAGFGFLLCFTEVGV